MTRQDAPELREDQLRVPAGDWPANVTPDLTPPAAAEPIQYVGLCPPCEWQGKGRSSSLRALADYDAHALTMGHVAKVLEATAAPDTGDEDDDDA